MAADEVDGGAGSKPQLLESPTEEFAALPHSQLATQPLDESVDLEGCATQAAVWGQLYPHCGNFPRIELHTDSFKLGRARNMDYMISESDLGSIKWLQNISKCQCEILRDSTGVFLKDQSSNGTFVNGHRVGRGNQWPLDHDSEISFATPKMKVFVFRSMEAQKEVFPKELTVKYTVSKMLGKGACGEVRLGFRIPDLHRVAIKIICKRSNINCSSAQAVLNEARILQSVDHPCIIRLEDVIDTEDSLFIVLELAEGGELFDKIIEKTKFNEAEAKLHFYQIASAIQYMHKKNICHRDLKPENVLLCSLDDLRPVVKITDMGLSKLVDLGTVLRTYCGTPGYLAPEILLTYGLPNSAYDLKVDCWSLGVILYILLSGTPPFTENKPNCNLKLEDQILMANYVFYPQLFNVVSSEAKDLISRLLKVEPSERLSADQILSHPWLDDDLIREQAEALMAEQRRPSPATLTMLNGNKRPATPMDLDHGVEKRHRVEVTLMAGGD